jgi:hypothetical protein
MIENISANKAEETPSRSITMLFSLTGFSQDMGFRVFSFERVAADRTRTHCTVRADLTLIRTYGIRVQDLPLLCRGLLERHDEDAPPGTLTFTEEDMRLHAVNSAAMRDAAALKKKPSRRIPSENTGSAWRVPQRAD